MPAKTTTSLQLGAEILFAFCARGDGEDRETYLPHLDEADRYAQELIGDRLHGCSFTFEVDELLKRIGRFGDAVRAGDAKLAHKAIQEYFERTGEDCSSPREAADEILGSLGYEHGRAGFLLGFTVALRLQREVAGGVR